MRKKWYYETIKRVGVVTYFWRYNIKTNERQKCYVYGTHDYPAISRQGIIEKGTFYRRVHIIDSDFTEKGDRLSKMWKERDKALEQAKKEIDKEFGIE